MLTEKRTALEIGLAKGIKPSGNTAKAVAKAKASTKTTVKSTKTKAAQPKKEEKAMKSTITEAPKTRLKAVVSKTAKKAPAKVKGLADRPRNELGHIIGTMSSELDTAILKGDATSESLAKMLMKAHGLKERPAGYRVKAHLEHLEKVKGCHIVTDKKSHVITMTVPKAASKVAKAH